MQLKDLKMMFVDREAVINNWVVYDISVSKDN